MDRKLTPTEMAVFWALRAQAQDLGCSCGEDDLIVREVWEVLNDPAAMLSIPPSGRTRLASMDLHALTIDHLDTCIVSRVGHAPWN